MSQKKPSALKDLVQYIIITILIIITIIIIIIIIIAINIKFDMPIFISNL